MKNTLVVNLYAGPGAGKSTAAAYIFTKLKMAGIDAELVTEYAKDKTWEGNDAAFKCQLYINAKQAFRISRVCGKVDVIITDSPILLGVVYADEDYVKNASKGEDKKYKNRLDFFINRDPSRMYNHNGRNQDADEAKALDRDIHTLLNEEQVKYENVDGNEMGYAHIFWEIVNKLNKEA